MFCLQINARAKCTYEREHFYTFLFLYEAKLNNARFSNDWLLAGSQNTRDRLSLMSLNI